MDNSARATLLHLLTTSYDEVKRRLTRRYGSEDFAAETLSETYIKIHSATKISEIRDPGSYLYRVVLNIAAQGKRSKTRQLLSGEDIDSLLHLADERQGPDCTASDREEVSMLAKALDALPPRQRDVLLASRYYEIPHLAIAKRYGISTRMVEKEIKSALEHCCQQLGRKYTQRFGPRFDKAASTEQ